MALPTTVVAVDQKQAADMELDQLQADCARFGRQLQEQGKQLPPEDNALRVAGKHPTGSQAYTLAYTRQRATDLKNQLLYGCTN